jgi:hypothetical protein
VPKRDEAEHALPFHFLPDSVFIKYIFHYSENFLDVLEQPVERKSLLPFIIFLSDYTV